MRRSLLLVGLVLVAIGLTVLPAWAGPGTPAKSSSIGSVQGTPGHLDTRGTVLYDQYSNRGSAATSSQNFESAFDAYDDYLADDFTVPASVSSWTITTIDADGVYFNGTGPANSFNVFLYQDANGLPGTLVSQSLNSGYHQSGSTFRIALTPPKTLTPGHYWVSLQSNQDFTTSGQWGWTDRTILQGNRAAWEDPGGGFGICQSWGYRAATCGIDHGFPDQVYRLIGSAQ